MRSQIERRVATTARPSHSAASAHTLVMVFILSINGSFVYRARSSPASLTHHPPDQDHACRLRISEKEPGKPHCLADKRKTPARCCCTAGVISLFGDSGEPHPLISMIDSNRESNDST